MIGRALVCLAVLPLAACGDQSMTQQNRYGNYTRAALFPDGTEAQPLPQGVVAQDDLERTETLFADGDGPRRLLGAASAAALGEWSHV